MISLALLEARALRGDARRRLALRRARRREFGRRAGLGCCTKRRRRRRPLGHCARRHYGRVDAFPSSPPPAVQPQIVALAQTLVRLLLRARARTGDGLGDVALTRRRLLRALLRIQVFDVWRPQHGSDAAARNAQSHRRRLGGPPVRRAHDDHVVRCVGAPGAACDAGSSTGSDERLPKLAHNVQRQASRLRGLWGFSSVMRAWRVA